MARVFVAAALIASLVLSLVGSAVSTWQVLRGQFRPNLVSRMVWTTATVIGFVTAVVGGAGWAAVPVGGLAAGSVILTAAALTHGGYWDLDRLDVICGVVALVGLAAWRLSGDPALATVAAVVADALAAIPTARHTLRAPQEESSAAYALSGAAAAVGLATLEQWSVATAGFSVYLLLLCTALVLLIAAGHRRARRG